MALADLKAFESLKIRSHLPPMKNINEFQAGKLFLHANPRDLAYSMASSK